MQEQRLIVLCGWPLTGKSTIAREVSKALAIRHVDIDDIRRITFGASEDLPLDSPERMNRERAEMAAGYDIMHRIVDANLSLGRSLITTATYSRKTSQEYLWVVRGKYPDCAFRLIWCRPAQENREEIKRRIEHRRREGDPSNVKTYGHYRETRDRFMPIELPHITIDTFPPHTIEECVNQALAYSNS